MRIVAGRLKGRTIVAPLGDAVRPTSDRARAALFDILIHGRLDVNFDGIRVLDGFCGTGALGIEALSRGAAHAVFIDRDVKPVEHNVKAIGLGSSSLIVKAAFESLAPAASKHAGPVDLVFLDPPYGSGLAGPAVMRLEQGGWLAEGVVCVAEMARDEAFEPPAGFAVVDERAYGAAKVVFLTRDAAA